MKRSSPETCALHRLFFPIWIKNTAIFADFLVFFFKYYCWLRCFCCWNSVKHWYLRGIRTQRHIWDIVKQTCTDRVKSSYDRHRSGISCTSNHRSSILAKHTELITGKVITWRFCSGNLLTAHLTRQSLHPAVCSDKSIKPTGMLNIFGRQDRYEAGGIWSGMEPDVCSLFQQ